MGHWTSLAVFVAAAAAATAPRGSSLRVETSADGIEIKAVAVPLADVLDRIARETGMKVLYDGAPPRKPVTLTLARRTSAEAVKVIAQLLEFLPQGHFPHCAFSVRHAGCVSTGRIKNHF